MGLYYFDRKDLLKMAFLCQTHRRLTFIKKFILFSEFAGVCIIIIRIINHQHKSKYSGTSVHEFNSFLEAVRRPKCS
jgi:hypothetical protein